MLLHPARRRRFSVRPRTTGHDVLVTQIPLLAWTNAGGVRAQRESFERWRADVYPRLKGERSGSIFGLFAGLLSVLPFGKGG